MKRRLTNTKHSRRGIAPRSALVPGAITRREWLRFLNQVSIGPDCHCGQGDSHPHWLWSGGCWKKGYAVFWWRGRSYMAHRFAYIALGGIIPGGRELDHLCRVRHCVTPQCFEIVTTKVNILRGAGPCAMNAQKTHCVNGHALVEGNLVRSLWARGVRGCKVCAQNRARAAYRATRTVATEQGREDQL